MKLFLTATFLAMLIAVTSSRFISPNQEIDREEVIDKEGGKVRVKWHVDSVAEMVSFEVIAQATGWVGFGISKSGGMTGADIVIGGVDADGNKYFKDRFSSGTGLPRIDAQQDWILADATEAAGVTTLKFERKFDTGDDKEDIAIEDDGVLFIWALGATDKIEYHIGERGTFPVNILEGLIPAPGETTVNSEATTVDGGENSETTTVDGGENSEATTVDGGENSEATTVDGGENSEATTVDGGENSEATTVDGGENSEATTVDGGENSEATTVDGGENSDATTSDSEGGSGSTTPGVTDETTEPATTVDSSSERNTFNVLLLVSMVFVVKRLY